MDPKVVFDGDNKLIIINSGNPTINIKQDIYSTWKQWVQVSDNTKYLPALRTTGGDPIGGGQYTGDIYFTINGWRISVSDDIEINGVIFSEDYPSPFISDTNTYLVTNKVSSLVQTISSGDTIQQGTTPKEVWDYLLTDANTSGSMGERLKALLTVAKFLGLK